MEHTSRRDFIGMTGAAALTCRAATPGIHYGYTAMTWGKAEKQAIEDISALGFEGIQFRIDAVTEFQPNELRELLKQHKLTFVALSGGEVTIDPAVEAEQIAKQVAHAKFVHDAGGLYLQILDKLTAYPRTVLPEECKRLGKLLTEIGRRTSDVGVPIGYHNHMNTIGEHPAQIDIILESSDPRFVKLELDTGHSVAGGGNPAEAIRKYHDRLLFLHLKDVVNSTLADNGKYPFKWVELGRGKVDFPAVFAALEQVKYRGWAVVELDRVPDKSTTPKESAMISRDYLEKKIGVKF